MWSLHVFCLWIKEQISSLQHTTESSMNVTSLKWWLKSLHIFHLWIEKQICSLILNECLPHHSNDDLTAYRIRNRVQRGLIPTLRNKKKCWYKWLGVTKISSATVLAWSHWVHSFFFFSWTHTRAVYHCISRSPFLLKLTPALVVQVWKYADNFLSYLPCLTSPNSEHTGVLS